MKIHYDADITKSYHVTELNYTNTIELDGVKLIPITELENLVEVMKKRNRQVGHTDGWYMGGAIMINIVEKRLSELKGEQKIEKINCDNTNCENCVNHNACDYEYELKGRVGMSNKLQKAKEIIKEYYDEADCGIFFSRNILGDVMSTVFIDDGLQIDVCYSHSYFEIFGLSNKEEDELEKYYDSLSKI